MKLDRTREGGKKLDFHIWLWVKILGEAIDPKHQRFLVGALIVQCLGLVVHKARYSPGTQT
jgi:hypothetical protein